MTACACLRPLSTSKVRVHTMLSRVYNIQSLSASRETSCHTLNGPTHPNVIPLIRTRSLASAHECSASTCALLRPSMTSTNPSALLFAKGTPLPVISLQVLDETQWQQQREAMLACIAAEDRRREAAQEARQVSSHISADAESAASVASAAPPAETHVHDAQPRLEAELDSDPANTSSSHEIAGYAESSATESDQDIGEDSDYVADSSFASSYADSEEDYMGEEQLIDLGSVDSDESSGMVCGSDHTGHSSGTSMVNADDLGDLEDEMEAPADESIVDHEEPDVLDYHEEPLTEAEKQQLTVDLSTRIKYHGKEQTLKEHLNLELLGPQGLARSVVSGGSWAVCSPEQSDKTVGIAGIGLVSARKHKPCVAMVCDLKSNAKKVQEGLQTLLSPFGIEVRYMSGMRCWKEVAASIIFLDAFKQGRIMLVMSTHKGEIHNLNSFLIKHHISGLTLSIDESDNVWSSYILDAFETMELCVRSQREAEMYRLLGPAGVAVSPGSCKPLGRGSRVRTLHQVSATHVNTIHWHQMWQLPFKSIEADKDLLADRGYALEKDMIHARSLDTDELTSKNNYAIDSQEVADEFKTFREDQRSGKLMMLCLTPYVRKESAMTSFAMAKRVLDEHCPNAICLVVHGRGINAVYKHTRKPEYSEGQGRVMHEISQDCQGSSKKTHQTKLTRQAGKAIESMDREHGLHRPIVVIGYSCIGRCTSIRSNRRVINHIIAGYQKGRTCGDLKQMLMRGAGSTRAVRQAQGYQHIRTVCTDEDWEVVQNLYDFTQDAMKLAATGRVEDLAAWTSADYNIKYLKMVQTSRPMVRRTMGMVDLSKVQLGGQPLPAVAPTPARKRRSGEPATAASGPGGSSEVSRPSKQHRQSTASDTDASWCRLMHSIWKVCIQHRSATIFRADLMQYCDTSESRISCEEINDQHRSPFTSIGRGRHFVKIDKRGGTLELKETGQEFCADTFGGVLVTDEE